MNFDDIDFTDSETENANRSTKSINLDIIANLPPKQPKNLVGHRGLAQLLKYGIELQLYLECNKDSLYVP